MKKASGFYLAAVTLVLSVVAIVAYAINCGTAYFGPSGMNGLVMGCLIGGAVASLLAMFVNGILGDILTIIAPAATIYGVMNMLNDRVAGIASIFTFEMNAQNMADLTSCIVALVAGLLAMILGIVTAFNAIKKAN